MATNISLVTYAGQTVTPLDDALIYETSVDNGIFDGCECTLSGGNTIHMNGGHGIICGRKFTVYESDTAVPLSSGGTLNGRMKVHLDLADTGEPIQFIIETAASLPALVQQDDVNVNNGVYEFEMCTFSVSETAVTNFTQVFEQAYSATREISTFPATTAQLASTDKILVQKANGDTYSLAYSDLINSLAATLITRSGTVTDSKHALSAVENNPNVSDTLAAKISSLNSSLSSKLSIGQYRSTVSFADAVGTPDITTGGAKLADDMKSGGITSHFGKVENLSSGAIFVTITGGANENYFSIFMFSYNTTFIARYTYRNGVYCVAYLYDMAGLY